VNEFFFVCGRGLCVKGFGWDGGVVHKGQMLRFQSLCCGKESHGHFFTDFYMIRSEVEHVYSWIGDFVVSDVFFQFVFFVNLWVNDPIFIVVQVDDNNVSDGRIALDHGHDPKRVVFHRQRVWRLYDEFGLGGFFNHVHEFRLTQPNRVRDGV
jgi:hypothetical protein